ncbi:hypothetical protein MRX96_046013 [Rhipicephalus microplus]
MTLGYLGSGLAAFRSGGMFEFGLNVDRRKVTAFDGGPSDLAGFRISPESIDASRFHMVTAWPYSHPLQCGLCRRLQS